MHKYGFCQPLKLPSCISRKSGESNFKPLPWLITVLNILLDDVLVRIISITGSESPDIGDKSCARPLGPSTDSFCSIVITVVQLRFSKYGLTSLNANSGFITKQAVNICHLAAAGFVSFCKFLIPLVLGGPVPCCGRIKLPCQVRRRLQKRRHTPCFQQQ